MSYMWGFLAGSNYFDPTHNRVGMRSEAHANSLYLQNYCHAHPLDTYQFALEDLSCRVDQKGPVKRLPPE
jgi:hypothetical protein